MRLLLYALFLAGCVDRDPCAGHSGACIGLHVNGASQVDQLGVRLDGAAQLDARTPSVAGVARNLPVSTALFLPPVSGTVNVSLIGWLRGADVGQAQASVAVKPGLHQTLTLTLVVGLTDLAVADLSNSDLSAPDLASFDLASRDQSIGDLASHDMAMDDLSMPPDLSGDLRGTGPRRVFVLPERGPILGALSSLDTECSTTADGAGLGNQYRAVISYPGLSARNHITLGQGRNVVVPSGRQVATDSTFFSISHLSAIDQLADGTVVTGCVFTEFSPNGDSITSTGDCNGWSDNTMTYAGYYGDVAGSDINWCLTGSNTCDTLNCHVYCIEQQ